jgi:transposase
MVNQDERNDMLSFSDPHDLDPETRDAETRSRLRAVTLYEKGHSIEEVVAQTGVSRSSLMNWYRAYRQQGIRGLIDRRQGGNNAKLTDAQLKDLGARLYNRTPWEILGSRAATPEGKLWTVEDLHNVIWEWYGVRYKSRTSYYTLLDRCVPRERRVE